MNRRREGGTEGNKDLPKEQGGMEGWNGRMYRRKEGGMKGNKAVYKERRRY